MTILQPWKQTWCFSFKVNLNYHELSICINSSHLITILNPKIPGTFVERSALPRWLASGRQPAEMSWTSAIGDNMWQHILNMKTCDTWRQWHDPLSNIRKAQWQNPSGASSWDSWRWGQGQTAWFHARRGMRCAQENWFFDVLHPRCP